MQLTCRRINVGRENRRRRVMVSYSRMGETVVQGLWVTEVEGIVGRRSDRSSGRGRGMQVAVFVRGRTVGVLSAWIDTDVAF
jgi:hypothetical protein